MVFRGVPTASLCLYTVLLLSDLSAGGQLSYDLRIFKVRCCDDGGECWWNKINVQECPAGFHDSPDLGMHCPEDLHACHMLRKGTDLLMRGQVSTSDDALDALTQSRDSLSMEFTGPASAVRCNLAVVLLLRSRAKDTLRAAHRLFTSSALIDPTNDAAVSNLETIGGEHACADSGPAEADLFSHCDEVDEYHHRMLHDDARSRAYQRAIVAALEQLPGAHVVDIGTGSGLLSIVAARAGASTVTAFEMVRPFAAIAAVHARWNNVSHQVKVVAARSSGAQMGTAHRADVVIHEIFDPGMLGEGVFASIRHAVHELAKPDAVLVPSRSIAYVHFTHSRTLSSHKLPSLDPKYGIDYTVVQAFCHGMFRSRQGAIMEMHTLTDAYKVTRREAVLQLDFANLPEILDGQKWVAAEVTSHGEINAAVLSFDAVFSSGEVLSTMRDGSRGVPPTHWGQKVFLLGNLMTVWPGDTVNVLVEWNSLQMWPVRYDVQRGAIGKRETKKKGYVDAWMPPHGLETDLTSRCLDSPEHWVPELIRLQVEEDASREEDGAGWSRGWDIVWGADGKGTRPGGGGGGEGGEGGYHNVRMWAGRIKRLFEQGKEAEAWNELVKEGDRSRQHAAAWHAVACCEMVRAQTTVERGLEHGHISIDIALASEDAADIVIENLMESASMLLARGDGGQVRALLERAPQLALRASYFEAMACTMVVTSMATAADDPAHAEAALRAALDTLSPKHPLRINPLSNLALLKHAQGRTAEALALLGEAILCNGSSSLKRTASSNLQYLAASAVDTQVLSDSLKFLNNPDWMSAYNASISNAVHLKMSCCNDDTPASSSSTPTAPTDSTCRSGPQPSEGALVLTVGEVTGTLSVLAARAGATRVVACTDLEWSMPMVQATVGLSGYGRVLDCAGKCFSGGGNGTADMQKRLGRPADVIIHDLIGTPGNFLRGTRRILGTIADVVQSLGDRYTVVVPCGVEIQATIAHSPIAWQYRAAPEAVLGVNVSLWSAVTRKASRIEVSSTSSMIPTYPLAPVKTIMSWNFTRGPSFLSQEDLDSERTVTIEYVVSVSGYAHCVVLTLATGFPGGGRYVDDPSHSLNPDVGRSFLILPREEWLRKGDVVKLTMTRDARGIFFMDELKVLN